MLGSFFSNLGETGNQSLLGGAITGILTPYTPMATTGTTNAMTGSLMGAGTTLPMTTAAAGTTGTNALSTMGMGTTTGLGMNAQDRIFSAPAAAASSAYSPLTSSFLSASQNMSTLLMKGINTGGTVSGTTNPF